MKKQILVIIATALSLALTGCSVATRQCGQFKPNNVITNYDAFKKIVVQEASNYGFTNPPVEVKPTKFNKYEGTMLFKLKTSVGTDTMKIDIERDTVCFSGVGGEADPKSAIAAMWERFKDW